MPARMAMIAIVTSNSIRVKFFPVFFIEISPLLFSQFQKVDTAFPVMGRIHGDEAAVRAPARMEIAAGLHRRDRFMMKGSEQFPFSGLCVDPDQFLAGVGVGIAVGEDPFSIRGKDHVRHAAVTFRELPGKKGTSAFVEHHRAVSGTGPVRIDQDFARSPAPDLVGDEFLPLALGKHALRIAALQGAGVQKRLPDVIKPLFTPLICFIVMVPLTVLAIGPLSSIAAKGIANGYNFLFDVAPALAAAVIGGIWQVVVIFGVHWGITPVCLANFEMYGHDSFQAYQTIAVIAQMAAAFGVFIKTRNKEFKGVAFSAGVTGIFGITEPAIYGVTLRLKKPFICGCISGAVGAVVASLFGSLYYAYAGLPGLLTTVNAISPEAPMSFAGEAIGAVVAIVLAIVLVQIIGFEDPKSENVEENTIEEKPVAAIAQGKKVIASPMNGTILPLDQVKDETFAQKVLGDGVAVIPSEGKVFAPADGTISALMDSYHAIGITCDNGVELLIHVGMDTLELKGKYFKPHIKTGDRVTKGTLLLEFDIPQIKKAGYEVTTPVIIANTDEFSQISCEGTGQIKAGADLISVE